MLPKCLMLAGFKEHIQNNCLNTFQIGMTSLMHFIFRVRYVSYLSNVFHVWDPAKVDHFPAESINISIEGNLMSKKKENLWFGRMMDLATLATLTMHRISKQLAIGRIIGEHGPDIGHRLIESVYTQKYGRVFHTWTHLSVLFRMSYLKWPCMWNGLHSMNYDLVA